MDWKGYKLLICFDKLNQVNQCKIDFVVSEQTFNLNFKSMQIKLVAEPQKVTRIEWSQMKQIG